MTHRVAVIILTYNQCNLTLQCLDSLAKLDRQMDRPQIIVVDNNSSDDTVQTIQNQHPTVIVLKTGANLGYTGGNNFGIDYALERGAEYVLILNNDTIVAPDMISALLAVAEQEPQAGFLGPKVYHLEEPECLQSTGIQLDRRLRSHHRGQDQIDVGQFDSIEEFEAISGCAMLVSRKVLDQIGLLDTLFFIYHEEIDWCLRARAAGFKNLYVPAAQVWHRKPQLRTATTAFTMYYMTRNMYLLMSKHKAGFRALAQTVMQNLVWLLNWTLNPKWRHNHEKRIALSKALTDAILGNYGKQRYRYGS